MSKDEGTQSANGFYTWGKREYQNGQELEDNGGTEEKIKAAYGLGAKYILMAFVLGHLEAPYALSVFFNQGVGVKPSDYVAKLLFGVALELGDDRCKGEKNQQEVPESMNKVVQELTKMVRETNSKIPSDKEVGPDVINGQMRNFSDSIIIPESNTTILGLIIKGKTESNFDQPTGEDGIQTEYVEITTTGAQSSDDDCCCIIL